MVTAGQNVTLKYAQTRARKSSHLLELIVTAFLFLFVLDEPISIAAAEIAYTGAALVWLAKVILVRRGVLQRSPLDMPILVYWLLCAASTIVAPLPASSWEGMRKISLVLLVLVVSHNVNSLRRVKQLVGLLLLSGLVTVAWAAWQYADGDGLRIYNLDPGTALYRAGLRDNDVVLRVDGKSIHHPQQLLSHLNRKNIAEPLKLRVVHGGGIDVLKDAVLVTVPSGEWRRATTVESLGAGIAMARPARARAFYSHYMSYAFFLIFPACLVFGLWLSSRTHFSDSGLIYLGLFLVFSLAMGMTLTRSAWLVLALGCAVEAWFYLRRWWMVFLLGLVLLSAVAGTSVAMHRLRGVGLVDLNDPGTDYRLWMWRDGLRIIKQHPWFGVGMNTIRDAWWQYDLTAYKKYGVRLHFHSTPIQIAVELGIPVLISWIVLMTCYCLLLARLVARTREGKDPFLYGLSLGILGGTVGFLGGSFVQYDFGDSVVVLLFWFLAGLALAVRRQLDSQLAVNSHLTGAAA